MHVSFSHFKSPYGRRLDLILRARRLECGFYGALTFIQCKGCLDMGCGMFYLVFGLDLLIVGFVNYCFLGVYGFSILDGTVVKK